MLEKMKLKKIFSYPMKKLSFLTVCGATLGLLACGGGGGGSSGSSANNNGSLANFCDSTKEGDVITYTCQVQFGSMDVMNVVFKPTSTPSVTLSNPTWAVYNYLKNAPFNQITAINTNSAVFKVPKAENFSFQVVSNSAGVQFKLLLQKTASDATQTANLQIASDVIFGIYSVGDLAAINSNLSGKYLQMKDLDLKNQTGAGFDASGWIPLGNGSGGNAFSGSYDGNGKKISNLTINRSASGYQGFFGASSGNLTKIALLNTSVTGLNSVGGLVGNQSGGSISQAYATGSVTGSLDFVGGLVGNQSGGSISQAYASETVKGRGFVGGLVGEQLGLGSSISQAYATGSVTGSLGFVGVGGLVGSQYGNISQVYASGAVKGNDDVGGLVGIQNKGSISQAYATGSVTGNGDRVGGLVGLSVGSISQAYALGDVTGSAQVGALVGGKGSGGTLANSFYLTKPVEAVNNAVDGGATKITAGNKTFSGFDAVWNMDGTNWPIFKGWNTYFLFLDTATDPQVKNPLP